MFSNLFSSSISFATVTPSLVTVGEPHDFSMTTLRLRGPRVTFTAFASRLSPFAISARAPDEKMISFAAMFVVPCSCTCGSVENREEVFLAHDEVLFAVDLHFRARVLREQNLVASLHFEGDDLAVLVALTGANGDDLGLDRLLFGRVR